MSFRATTLSADAVRAATDQRRREFRDQKRKQDAEQERLRKELMESRIRPQALELIAKLVGDAVERDAREVLLMRFPSSWLPDHGRAINNNDRTWFNKLEGIARRVYEYYEKELRPRGFEMRAMILEWPGGMPGDVGLFLIW